MEFLVTKGKIGKERVLFTESCKLPKGVDLEACNILDVIASNPDDLNPASLEKPIGNLLRMGSVICLKEVELPEKLNGFGTDDGLMLLEVETQIPFEQGLEYLK
jgi:hypothetical protein